MYRIVGRNCKYYALEIYSIEEDEIKEFTDSAEPVIITEDIADLYCFGITPDQVEIVEKGEDD